MILLDCWWNGFARCKQSLSERPNRPSFGTLLPTRPGLRFPRRVQGLQRRHQPTMECDLWVESVGVCSCCSLLETATIVETARRATTSSWLVCWRYVVVLFSALFSKKWDLRVLLASWVGLANAKGFLCLSCVRPQGCDPIMIVVASWSCNVIARLLLLFFFEKTEGYDRYPHP